MRTALRNFDLYVCAYMHVHIHAVHMYMHSYIVIVADAVNNVWMHLVV